MVVLPEKYIRVIFISNEVQLQYYVSPILLYRQQSFFEQKLLAVI
jgi:hypothetical protein